MSKINLKNALTRVAQLVGHHPAKRNVASSIPSKGTSLGCRFGISLQLGCVREATGFSLTSMFLSLSFPSKKLNFFLKNKINFKSAFGTQSPLLELTFLK